MSVPHDFFGLFQSSSSISFFLPFLSIFYSWETHDRENTTTRQNPENRKNMIMTIRPSLSGNTIPQMKWEKNPYNFRRSSTFQCFHEAKRKVQASGQVFFFVMEACRRARNFQEGVMSAINLAYAQLMQQKVCFFSTSISVTATNWAEFPLKLKLKKKHISLILCE